MNFITTCTVLLVVFVIHSAYGFDEVFKNKDCPGNDVYKFKKSLIDCMAECNSKTICMGIVHKKKTCWLKSKCDKRQDSRESSIYLKPTYGFRFKKHFTCPGNDVVIVREKMSITDCMIKCNKNPACIAVTYNRGTCTGKTSCFATINEINAITYFRPEGGFGFILPGNNCPGNDICKKGMQRTFHWQECLELCGSYPQCVGIVHNRRNRSCLLKWLCRRGFTDRYSTIYFLERRKGSNTCTSNCGCDHNCLVKNRKLECSCDEGFALSTNDSRSCIRCHERLDVVILLDTSGSVKKSFPKVQQFVKDMIDSFIIGENDTKVGLVVFGRKATHVFFLKSHTNKTEMKNAVDSIPKPKGKTNMHIGLEFVAAQFTDTNGQRTGVPNALVVVTDGKFEDGLTAKIRARELRDADVVIYAVGIAKVNVDEVISIASSPRQLNKNYFLTTDFIGLVEDVKHAMFEKVCTETENIYHGNYLDCDNCEHHCEDINGTKTCSCNEGYALADDRKSCTECKKALDIVFLLDGSGSVREFWDKEIEFVLKIVESLIIDENHVKVGLVVFGDSAEHFVYLKEFQNKPELETAIKNVRPDYGSTYLTTGLEFVQVQFNARNDARPKVTNVLVILTDGFAKDPKTASDTAQELKNANVTIYSVGIGTINPTEIQELSSQPQKERENFFITKDFNTLVKEVKDVLLRNICQD